MQRLTDKIGFLAKAVEDADYQGVKEFASDMKKLGVPLEHAPQVSAARSRRRTKSVERYCKLSMTSYPDL